MHTRQLREILRDAEVADAMIPIIREHSMSELQMFEALRQLQVPRAANVVAIAFKDLV